MEMYYFYFFKDSFSNAYTCLYITGSNKGEKLNLSTPKMAQNVVAIQQCSTRNTTERAGSL